MSDDYDLKPIEPKGVAIPGGPADQTPAPRSGDVVPPGAGPLDLAPLELAPVQSQKIPAGTPDAVTTASSDPLGFVMQASAAPALQEPKVIIEPPDLDGTDEDDPAAIDARDIEKHKGICILSYIPPLFVIPLLIAPTSRAAKFHANQGLLLFIIAVACMLGSAVLELCYFTVVPIVGDMFGLKVIAWIGACAAHVGAVALILVIAIMAIFGIVSAANGETKPLPLIGKHVLIR